MNRILLNTFKFKFKFKLYIKIIPILNRPDDVIYYVQQSSGRLREFKMFVMKSQIMRKLNPRKRPRMPPQSATRDRRGNASCSVSRMIV